MEVLDLSKGMNDNNWRTILLPPFEKNPAFNGREKHFVCPFSESEVAVFGGYHDDADMRGLPNGLCQDGIVVADLAEVKNIMPGYKIEQ